MTRPQATVGTAVVAVAAAAYVIARAVLVPLTYDEASSFDRYIDADAAALFDFATATNHFLNTALSRLSVMTFGVSPLSLRLPNVLAGVVYLAIVVAFARRIADPAIALAGAVLLMTNPYVLDFFALSRGYGLSVALLMASVFVLLRPVHPPPLANSRASYGGTSPKRPSAAKAGPAALVLAALAVSASFVVLPAFLALVAIVVVQVLRENAPHYAPRTDGRGFPWRAAIVWLLLTGAFSWMVFSRERVLSASEFVPMVVRVTGLYEEELAAIRVFRIDSTGRLREIQRRPGGIWHSGPVQDEWALHVTLPAAADRNLAGLDVMVGDQVFRRDRLENGPWVVEDFDMDRVLISTAALAWQGNTGHTWLVAMHTAATLAALTLFGMMVVVLSRIPAVARRLDPGLARWLIAVLMSVAGIAAAPLYLLKRDGQLFFGGTEGLSADIVGSLVAGTTYHALTGAAPAVVVTSVAAAMLVIPFVRRWRDAAMVSALIALVVLQAVVQRALFDVPFPTGRTALFLIPLLLLLTWLNAGGLAMTGARARQAAAIAMLVLAGVSAVNFALAANLTHTADWRHDAATPAMLDRVARDVASPPAVVRIGVEWMHYPVARYYAERMSAPASRYDVLVLPGDGRPLDFIYAPDGTDVGRATLVERFSVSGSTLSRPAP